MASLLLSTPENDDGFLCKSFPFFVEPDSESGAITYYYEVSRPDSGYATQLVAVRCRANWDFHQCHENTCIELEAMWPIQMVRFFQTEILPTLDIPPQLDAVQVDFSTIGDEMISVGRVMEYPFHFLPLPDNLCPTLPRVSIHSLRLDPLNDKIEDKSGVVTDKFRVVRLSSEPEEIYAIKEGAFSSIVPMGSQRYAWPHILHEVEILDSIDSPFLEKPSHIVTDDKSAFRGFLKPVHRRGAINRPLREGSFRCFDLPTRFKWLDQIASVVVKLHQKAVYGVNLEVTHLLITDSGDMCVISVGPQEESHKINTMAPEYQIRDGHWRALTPAADVWSLGFLFWQFWEALPGANMYTDTEYHTWTKDPDSNTDVPGWYRSLAEKCLSDKPEDRPTASEVLDRLREETPSYLASRGHVAVKPQSQTS